MIIEMDMYSSIRTRYLEGESIRSIARCLKISRPTVKKYCEGAIARNNDLRWTKKDAL